MWMCNGDYPMTPQGPYSGSSLLCNGHNLMPSSSGAYPWSLVESTALSGWDGTSITTATCTMQLGPGGPGASRLNVDVPIIRLLIYDSVDTLPPLNYTSLVPPLGYNPVTSIFVDQQLLAGHDISWSDQRYSYCPG